MVVIPDGSRIIGTRTSGDSVYIVCESSDRPSKIGYVQNIDDEQLIETEDKK